MIAAVAAAAALSLLVPQQLDQIVRDGSPGVEAHVHGRDLARGGAPLNGQVRIGSITKSFVAVATLELVAEGKVSLDEPVNRFVPHVADRRITVRQVLQHTSGLPDYVVQVGVPKIADIRDRYFAPHELLDAALAQPVSFQPGEKYGYSNTNYVVAGLLIQKVTGRPVGEALDGVIRKAGLKDTYWPGQGEQRIRGRHAQAFALSDLLDPRSKVVDATDMETSAAWASGAMVSTPRDVAKFFKALLGGELLPKAQLDEMRKTVAVDEKSAYGLGLESTELSCGGVWWGHGGSIHGWASLGGATDGGKSAAITLTALPGTFGDDPAKKFQQVFDVVDTALCRK
ncbi:serine hydrolase domain-containing protein [Lentzea sp. DG1S-22]|uniref:serine hydrolase domain-containing protein n=1 Tax=Lentzea sp. DG1S-22 TaxID=3108822 RepID=UPI002E774E5C|nr:serine hydrolase domain-containing protein [Lentzea sp. DG1S-22]WVH79233.1 serine hydrolase domain-containing protein [Lentzea sp. DG1S-22]